MKEELKMPSNSSYPPTHSKPSTSGEQNKKKKQKKSQVSLGLGGRKRNRQKVKTIKDLIEANENDDNEKTMLPIDFDFLNENVDDNRENVNNIAESENGADTMTISEIDNESVASSDLISVETASNASKQSKATRKRDVTGLLVSNKDLNLSEDENKATSVEDNMSSIESDEKKESSQENSNAFKVIAENNSDELATLATPLPNNAKENEDELNDSEIENRPAKRSKSNLSLLKYNSVFILP